MTTIPAKSWYTSKTIRVNSLLLILFVVGAVVDAAGVFHLSIEVVTGLGIFTGAVNLALRLVTNTAIVGTPAAEIATVGKPAT